MQQHVYSVGYALAPINFSGLTMTLYHSVRKTLFYSDIKYSRLYNRLWVHALFLQTSVPI
jgi:hypothetical protein